MSSVLIFPTKTESFVSAGLALAASGRASWPRYYITITLWYRFSVPLIK